jgi:WD40 repeat protein
MLTYSLKVITSMSVSSSSQGSSTTEQFQQQYPSSAIASMEYLPFNQKTGYGLIMVGTMDGWFESWKVCAFEAEEDEEVVHADEEDATIKLRFVKYFRRLMFHSPLSVLTCSTEEKRFFSIALGSIFSERVFILKVPNDYNTTVVLNFTVNVHSHPASCVWNGRIFWIGCQNGLLCSFNPSRGQKEERNESKPHASWETSLPSISSMCSANKGEFLVVTSPSNDSLTILSVQSESNSSTHSSVFGEASLKFRNPSKNSPSHRDMVVCVASSPNSAFVAAGCVDGSIHLWSIISGDIKLAAKAILHRQAVLSISFSVDSSLIMSCGADGSVFFSTVNVPARLFFKAALGDSKFYEKVAAGDEQNNNLEGRKGSVVPPSTVMTPAVTALSSEGSIIPETWFEFKRAEALEELKKRSAIKVSEVFSAVEDITFRLKSILDRNNGRSEEMEKVDRTDLVVDLDGRDRTYLENENLLESTRNLYSMRNLWNEVNASRVREICWDSMETHERQILPFNVSTNNFVSSFSIQGCSEQDKKRIDIVKRLRGVEIRSQRAHHQGVSQRLPTFEASIRTSWAKSICGFSSAVSWIANDGSRWPSQNIVETLLRKEKGEDPLEVKAKEKTDATTNFSAPEGQREISGLGDVIIPTSNRLGATSIEDEDELSTTSLFESDREIDETSIFNLLYAPEAVRTQTQKRTQIILLTEIARMLRANFNSFFEELSNEKEDVMASVELRNSRLESILEELKQVEALFVPKLTNTELRGAAIIITDEELTSRPYESDAIRIARLRDEEMKRKLVSLDETEDFKGRALDEMMNGTLEVKRDVFADVAALQKPSWMEELSASEMSESQLKETEVFEAKLKVVQEEQLKYRKVLEQEMKKLKTETVEACKTFDEKVANVGRIKILVQREILTQELYTSRLGLTMAKREQSWGLLKSTEAQIEVMRKERAELRVRSEKFNVHVEAMKNSLNTIQEEERSLDKTFKRDFQTLCNNNFDQDSLKVFADLFRRREYAASPDDDDDGSQDPDAEESDMLASGSQRGSRSRSKQASARNSKRNPNASSKRNTKALGSSKRNTTMGSSKKGGGGIGAGSRMMKASKGGNARSTAGGGGGKERLGPMQEAAQALKNAQQPEANEKDPYFTDLLQKDKLVRIAESKIPLLMSLNIDSDCPENFVVDQYTWSKLQDLRNVRIEKEITSKRMAIEYIEQRRKLDDLTNEENAIVSVIRSLRQARDETLIYLESIETNLEVLVCLKQGQDEVDKDAVVTEYGDAVLVPTAVVDKFNSRIKELGKEKVGVLSRIKQFRRKINLIEWNSAHLEMESQHMEEYFTDLQLLRVTRELQQVIRDGSNTEQTKVITYHRS